MNNNLVTNITVVVALMVLSFLSDRVSERYFSFKKEDRDYEKFIRFQQKFQEISLDSNCHYDPSSINELFK